MALNALPSSGIGLCFMVWFISHQASLFPGSSGLNLCRPHPSGGTINHLQPSTATFNKSWALHQRYANPLNARLASFFTYSLLSKWLFPAWISPEDAAHICATTAMNIWEKMITRFCHFRCFPLKKDDYCDTNVENVLIPYFEVEYMNINKRFRVFLYNHNWKQSQESCFLPAALLLSRKNFDSSTLADIL